MDEPVERSSSAVYKGLVNAPKQTPGPKGTFDFTFFIIRTRLGISVLTALLSLLLSVYCSPPFMMVKESDPLKTEKVSYTRAVAVSIFLGLTVFMIPTLIQQPR
jgi:hypothetical protein